MSTDTENTRVIVDAADRINEIIKRSDQRKRADLQQIRKDMRRAVHKTWIDRFADWINGR